MECNKNLTQKNVFIQKTPFFVPIHTFCRSKLNQDGQVLDQFAGECNSAFWRRWTCVAARILHSRYVFSLFQILIQFILAQYQTYVLSISFHFAVLSIFTCALKVCFCLEFLFYFHIQVSLATISMCAAIIIYADLAFPLVMCSFAAIFERIKLD